MRIPDFFIIGAPRAGTTSLCSYLAEHPLIYFSRVKEPHFFSTDYPNQPRLAAHDYECLFAGANAQHLAVGEGSTCYLSSTVAVPKILEYSPKARFIVLVRHPVELAYSFHGHSVYHGNEVVEDFEQAWRLQAERAAGRCLPPNNPEIGLLQYARLYQLGSQLERLYENAGRERVLVHFFDDFRRCPAQGYERTLGFLGVPSDGRRHFNGENQSKKRRSRALASMLGRLYELKVSIGLNRSIGIGKLLERANTKPLPRKPLTPDFRREMMDSFADDIMKLGALTSRDLSSWLAINE
jgi:hypothetical protein